MTDEALLATLLATLLEQERRLQFDAFDNDVAFAIGSALIARGQREGLPITVDVTRTQQQLFHMALPGTVADNDHWVRRKTATVYRFGHSSYYFGTLCRHKGWAFAEMFGVDPRDYTSDGGSFPVFVKRVGLVGTVTVSGLPQADDHQAVVEAIEKHLASA